MTSNQYEFIAGSVIGGLIGFFSSWYFLGVGPAIAITLFAAVVMSGITYIFRGWLA